MKYFKIVSGKGRVEMTQKEIEQMKSLGGDILSEQPSQIEALEQKVERLSKLLDSLKENELLKNLFAAAERRVEENGDS